MADEDQELKALKARLAQLEAGGTGGGKPRIANGFGQGFFGCFGVLAAIVLLFVVLYSCGIYRSLDAETAAERGETAESMAESRYHLACAKGFADMQARGAFKNGSLSLLPPRVIAGGPPTRVLCDAVSARGDGVITVDVYCDDGSSACTTLKSAVEGGEVIYPRR